ncbi:MAG TPA: L-histidine N(alpha)-methyltransferase [Polyangiaceae bacterium]|nr:L-histidine N(alpha)-methyltransferase [Polyangiaceae bacterium]
MSLPGTSAARVKAWESQLVRLAREPGADDFRRFERDVHDGLARVPKALPSLYFYDARGSDLFRRIMDLPEYYLTRAEREVLERHGRVIAELLAGRQCDVVDLGAGDGAKTRILLGHLARAGSDVRYLPVDVSDGALATVLDACAAELPWLPTEGVVAEYEAGIRWLSRRDANRSRLVLFLGSNVGNLDDVNARGFFSSLYEALLPGDHVLVGFDLVKDVRVMQPAYDDASGVTAEFNLNLLRRINRELGANFDENAFRHYATFSPSRRAMESYLLSCKAQKVRVGRREYAFEAWEPLHTEISRKYYESDVRGFAEDVGFVEVGHFFDERRLFVDALWRVGPAEGAR